MSSTSAPGRRGTLVAAATAAVLALTGAGAVVAGLSQDEAGPPQPAAAAEPALPSTPNGAAEPEPVAAAPQPATTRAAPAPAAAGQELDVKTMVRSTPVTLSIPSIGVDTTSLVELGKEADGSLEVPRDYGQAGWFTHGPAPGQFGPSVIAGHVDSKTGPGIFYRLGELQPGAKVSVDRADGSTATFVVDKVERYPKQAFPTLAVYGDTTHRSELRLITCGGEFDPSTGHYVDNVVAYAHLI